MSISSLSLKPAFYSKLLGNLSEFRSQIWKSRSQLHNITSDILIINNKLLERDIIWKKQEDWNENPKTPAKIKQIVSSLNWLEKIKVIALQYTSNDQIFSGMLGDDLTLWNEQRTSHQLTPHLSGSLPLSHPSRRPGLCAPRAPCADTFHTFYNYWCTGSFFLLDWEFLKKRSLFLSIPSI